MPGSDYKMPTHRKREYLAARVRPEVMAGIADWVAGMSKAAAARKNGIPVETLAYHIKKHADVLIPDRKKRAQEAMDLALEYNKEAGRQAMEKLLAGNVPDPRVDYGISKDAIARIAPVLTPENEGPSVIEKLLERLGDDGGSVEIKVQAHPKAIDVSPVPSTEGTSEDDEV